MYNILITSQTVCASWVDVAAQVRCYGCCMSNGIVKVLSMRLRSSTLAKIRAIA